MARTTYEVVVGNVGRVYNGTSKREADKVYHDYCKMSRSGYGRAGGEEVGLFVDGELEDSYSPPYHDEDEYRYDDVGLDDIQMRERNPRKKGSAVYDSTLSITSSPMFYTPNVFRSVMNDAQFKPVPKWCKSVLDAMNIPPAVAKELLSGKRAYKINDARETVEIPMTAAELDEAVAMSKRR